MPRSNGSQPSQNGNEPLRWCYEDFVWFYEELTLPQGKRAKLEGFQHLILKEIFAPGRVETVVLIPKGHAKTTLMAALAVYHAIVRDNANIYIGAADRIQAAEMYRFASHFVNSEPGIFAKLKVLRSKHEIVSRTDQGFISVLASDDSRQGGKHQGFNPTLALLDELHAHENENLYVDMRSGLFKNKGILVIISTAGWDQESKLGTLRQEYLDSADIRCGLRATDDGGIEEHEDGRLTIARRPSGRAVMLEWACNADDDLDDIEVVKLANPASWVDLESIRDGKESLKPWIFKRYRANHWTLAYESWLPEGAWDALADPAAFLRDELPIYVALDMARYRDCAALAIVQPREGHPAFCRAWIRQGSEDDPVPYPEVMDRIRGLHNDYELVACGYDAKYFDQAGQELHEEGVAMEEFPQSNERMCPAADGLRRAIVVERALVHDGDQTLARHIAAPKAKDVGDSMFKLVKSRNNGPPIDACVALAMAWALACTEHPVPGVVF